MTKVTLAIKGESGGVIGNIPIISPPFEFPPTLAFWENSLVAVDNPHIVGPTVELSATSAGFSCDTSCPPEFDTPLGPLPFAAEAVQSDLSDFKGAGSNAFVLVVSGPAEFSDIFGNATVTETILTTVPEPSTWAMMLLGFAGLGFAGYRTSRNRAALAA